MMRMTQRKNEGDEIITTTIRTMGNTGDDKEGQNNYKATKTHMRMIRMAGKKNV